MKLENVVIGKDYWVVNGHWSFTVKDKTIEGVKYYCHYTKETNIMPYDVDVTIEEYIK